jgi:hypothetical protein
MAPLDLTGDPAAGSFVPDLSEWDAWHPTEAARRLAGVDVPWCVVAGWSLDLFRGEQTREHEDLEIAVPLEGFPAIREALADLEIYAIVEGKAAPVTETSLAVSHQTWVRDPAARRWRLDVMREQWDDDTWVCRRHPSLRRPGSEVIAHTADGIPYAQPEIALLFKAKAVRPKDEEDFASVLPLLEGSRRRWLADALTLVHPGHPWLEALA